jgi:hypothetical protein
MKDQSWAYFRCGDVPSTFGRLSAHQNLPQNRKQWIPLNKSASFSLKQQTGTSVSQG